MIPQLRVVKVFKRFMAFALQGLAAFLGLTLLAPLTAAHAQVYFSPYFHAYAYPGPEYYYPDRGPPAGYAREPYDEPRISRRAVYAILSEQGYRLEGPIRSRGLTLFATGVTADGRAARFAIDAENGEVLNIRGLEQTPEPRVSRGHEMRRAEIEDERRARREEEREQDRGARPHRRVAPPSLGETPPPTPRASHAERPPVSTHAALPPTAPAATKPPGPAPTTAVTPTPPPAPAQASPAAPAAPATPAAAPAAAPPSAAASPTSPPSAAAPVGSAHRAVTPPPSPPAQKESANNQPDPTVSVLVKSKSDGPAPASVVVRPPPPAAAPKAEPPPPPNGGY